MAHHRQLSPSSHLFITCPVAATVTDWLCRLWQAMTGYLPVVSAASLLAADTPSEQLLSDALLQTWHRLRLAVLHSIWAASQIAQASRQHNLQMPQSQTQSWRHLLHLHLLRHNKLHYHHHLPHTTVTW